MLMMLVRGVDFGKARPNDADDVVCAVGLGKAWLADADDAGLRRESGRSQPSPTDADDAGRCRRSWKGPSD